MEERLETAGQIDLFYYPGLHTHSFCLSLYLKAGCMYESDEDNGITHFLEHLLFRNMNHCMNGQMYRRLDACGLYFNGATYKEFMHLYILGAPEHFEEAAEILLKVFEPLRLPVSEIETEKQRVKAEIREAEDFKSLDYFAQSFVWDGVPLRNTILGTRRNVTSFTRRRLERCRSEILTGDSAFFYVTGRVRRAQVDWLAREIEKKSEKLSLKPDQKSGAAPIKRDNRTPVPADFCNRALQVHLKNSSYTMAQFSFDLETSRYTGAELALLYDILFSGENSLIHQELSEKRGWIYSYTSALEKYRNIGRLYFSYEIGKRELVPSVKLVLKSLTELRDETLLAEKLPLVLAEYVDNAFMIYDDNEAFNWQRAYECHIMDGSEKTIEESRNQFLNVTPERLRQMTEEIFRADHLVLCLKGKKDRVDLNVVEKIIKNWASGWECE